MSDSPPVETKVVAARAGAGGGAIVTAFLVWFLGVFIWHAPGTAEGATKATAAVPFPVAALIGVIVAVVCTHVSGYWAAHTLRPDLGETPAPVPPAVPVAPVAPPAPPAPVTKPAEPIVVPPNDLEMDQ